MNRIKPAIAFLFSLFLPCVSFAGTITDSAETTLLRSVCGERLVSSYQSLDWLGGNFSFNVTAPSNCTYSITSTSLPWINVTSGPTATGNSTVTYTITSNPSLRFPRVGVIIVGGRTFSVNQGRAEGINYIRTAVDFNSDMTSDFVAIQNESGRMRWWSYRYHITPGASTSVVDFGSFDQDVPVPLDYDGDTNTDFAVWRGGASPGAPAYFYVLNSSTNTVTVISWGVFGDDPKITQDFDGDAMADFAVTRRENGTLVWYIKLSATPNVYIQTFGFDTDRPIRGDYDGDFHADIAVYRPAINTPNNTFIVSRSSDDAVFYYTFGLSSIDKIVPGDYDGDGSTDYAVWRTTTGVWYWTGSRTGITQAYLFGSPGDLPVPGDYNNDFKSDYAIWRPSTGSFWIQNTGGTPFVTRLVWGSSGMIIPANSLQVQ